MPRVRQSAATRAEEKRKGQALSASLRAQGLSPTEVFAEITRRNVEHARASAHKKGRCLECWHTAVHGCCICADMMAVRLRVPVNILMWYHARDYMNAGDDAKLLKCCIGGRGKAEILINGTKDDEVIKEAVQRAPDRTLLLFPDETAITIDAFFGRPLAESGSHMQSTAMDLKEELIIIVLNGTWNNVKPMLKQFNKTIDPGGKVRHVALQPNTLSVYKRAQRRMGKEVSLERICTVEAVSMLLKECGERTANCDRLVEYVELNNAALGGKPALQRYRESRTAIDAATERNWGWCEAAGCMVMLGIGAALHLRRQ